MTCPGCVHSTGRVQGVYTVQDVSRVCTQYMTCPGRPTYKKCACNLQKVFIQPKKKYKSDKQKDNLMADSETFIFRFHLAFLVS